MIDFLRGIPAHAEADYVVLDVGGVGYRVFCANPYAVSVKSGEPVTMYIHHHVREDAILLFGFATRDEQALFRHLLNVNGIGPRVAIGILSAGRPEAVIAAIEREDVTFLTKLPGIGKKTAQRIILDLKDKLGELSASLPVRTDALAYEEAPSGNTSSSEAKQALVVLGYSEAEIDRVWPAVLKKSSESDTTDAIVKKALQVLFQS